MKRSHSMPFGAQLLKDGSTRFRLWAPKAQCVELCLEEAKGLCLPLKNIGRGWFALTTSAAPARTRYRFRVDGKTLVPDPASRFQPEDVHGPSEVVNPDAFEWTDRWWRGRPWHETVIYELHVGTFTPEGTFAAAEQKLDYLRELGITALELMPVADFSGRRNWGYDGVLLYAPDSNYGPPDDLKHLVQAAHSKGLMIFLDVVYNHFGPDGNYLQVYSPQFFTDRHHTPWGDAINFDGPESRVVRDFLIHNALYWLEEYHLDGLRLDAVHAIVDDSQPDILTELAQVVRQRLGDKRFIHLILENGNNAAHYLRRDKQTRPKLYSAQWNDDIHHALHVLLTGESDGYYADYVAQPVQQLGRCLAEGFAFQGQYSEFHGANRGEPSSELPPTAFVSFLQNHDQIGNRPLGERISQVAELTSLKAAIEILLLSPETPLLFMGEEFMANSPFLFFCDFHGDLAKAVTTGRRNEFSRFPKFNSPETRDQIPDPNAEQTFLRSKLDWSCLTVENHARWLHFYRELLTLRQRIIVPRLPTISGRAEFSACEQGRISVHWPFGQASRLILHANLGTECLPIGTEHSARPFYCSSSLAASDFEKGRLSPWSVVWSIME
jgi:maltooligosyltrehalose trehalohydrolase